MRQLPEYDQLPLTDGGARSAWGLFGESDGAGLVNLLTPTSILHAVSLVKRGAVFSLNAPLDLFEPPLFGRAPLRRNPVVIREGYGVDEYFDNFYPQGSSQWDGLGHVSFADGTFYNGASLEEVIDGTRNSIEDWAATGIVGRGVMLDVLRAAKEVGRAYQPGSDRALSVEDLETAREMAGVAFEPGDILLLHTGFLAWYESLSSEGKREVAPRDRLRCAGLEHSEDMARYLWNSHACAIAADNPALEVWPTDYRPEAWPFGNLHRIVIGQFGMAIGELWRLAELAADCMADGRFEMLVVSAPVSCRGGGVGSTANALALK